MLSHSLSLSYICPLCPWIHCGSHMASNSLLSSHWELSIVEYCQTLPGLMTWGRAPCSAHPAQRLAASLIMILEPASGAGNWTISASNTEVDMCQPLLHSASVHGILMSLELEVQPSSLHRRNYPKTKTKKARFALFHSKRDRDISFFTELVQSLSSNFFFLGHLSIHNHNFPWLKIIKTSLKRYSE